MLYINGKPVPNLEEIQYLQAVIHYRWTRAIKKVIIDVGQKETGKEFITDANNTNIRFNSEADVMNYLYKNGWKIINKSYTKNESGMPICVLLCERRTN